MDYKCEEYEGKVVTVILNTEFGKEYFAGFVAGLDESIGFTVVDYNDKNNYLLCFEGPASTLWNPKWSTPEYLKQYRKLFDTMYKMIQGGLIDFSTLSEYVDMIVGANAETCPFGQ